MAAWLSLACASVGEYPATSSWNGIRPQNDARLVTRETLRFFWTANPEVGDPEAYVRCLGGPGPFVTTTRTFVGEIRSRRAPWLEGPWSSGHPAYGWDAGEATMNELGRYENVAPMSQCREERDEGDARKRHLYIRVRSISFLDEAPDAIPAVVDVEIVTEGRSGRFFECRIWKRAAEWSRLQCASADPPLGHPGG